MRVDKTRLERAGKKRKIIAGTVTDPAGNIQVTTVIPLVRPVEPPRVSARAIHQRKAV